MGALRVLEAVRAPAEEGEHGRRWRRSTALTTRPSDEREVLVARDQNTSTPGPQRGHAPAALLVLELLRFCWVPPGAGRASSRARARRHGQHAQALVGLGRASRGVLGRLHAEARAGRCAWAAGRAVQRVRPAEVELLHDGRAAQALACSHMGRQAGMSVET